MTCQACKTPMRRFGPFRPPNPPFVAAWLCERCRAVELEEGEAVPVAAVTGGLFGEEGGQ